MWNDLAKIDNQLSERAEISGRVAVSVLGGEDDIVGSFGERHHFNLSFFDYMRILQNDIKRTLKLNLNVTIKFRLNHGYFFNPLHFEIVFESAYGRESARGEYDATRALGQQVLHAVARTQTPVVERATASVRLGLDVDLVELRDLGDLVLHVPSARLVYRVIRENRLKKTNIDD